MTYDYFYGQQAEMFAFYRVPKVLFTEDCFWNVSTDAKLLYGILLDRMNLSARNGWLDEEGRVYIIFTIEEIKGALGCAEKKAVKLLDELEKKCGLIERKRQGLGKPNLIYVKNFISGSVERQFLNCQKDNSGVVKNTIQELSKAQGNNTDTNYIDFSDTDPFFPSGFCGKEVDETDEFTRYYQYFYEQLSMDYLKQDYPYDHEILDLILHLIIEVMCSNRKQIRIASDDKPIEIVKSSFMKLDSEHIRFVSCTFIIRFLIWRNSAISISSVGLGGISFSRIRFCRKSFAFATIPRNRLGSHPLLLIEWLAFSCISVCLTSKIFASEIPDNNAISAVLFHSCLAVLSASISAALGLFLPIFLVGR